MAPPRRWGSLRYRFTRDSSEQVDFRTNWAFNRAWSLQLENNYDVDNSENLRTLVGFGYSSCCWGISAVGQRRFDTNSDEKDSFLLTFELRGIASITQRF